MKKIFGKEVVVLWISLAALVCAFQSLSKSLDQLVEEQDSDMD